MNTAMGNFNASELTPSESLVTSDDEDVKVNTDSFQKFWAFLWFVASPIKC